MKPHKEHKAKERSQVKTNLLSVPLSCVRRRNASAVSETKKFSSRLRKRIDDGCGSKQIVKKPLNRLRDEIGFSIETLPQELIRVNALDCWLRNSKCWWNCLFCCQPMIVDQGYFCLFSDLKTNQTKTKTDFCNFQQFKTKMPKNEKQTSKYLHKWLQRFGIALR